MLYSMTGFGRISFNYSSFNFDIEIKSFNSRYLEFAFKSPGFLQIYEFEIRELIKEKIRRGKVSLSINLKAENNGKQIFFNEEKIKDIYSNLKLIRKTINSKEKIKIAHFLSFNEIFSPDFLETNDDLKSLLLDNIRIALDSFNLMRQNEGVNLKNDLVERLDSIQKGIDEIENSFRSGITEYYEKLKERVKVLVEDISSFQDRMEMELALLTDKADITEECVRLKSHLSFFKKVLETNESEVGKKLNFLCQEMHREANTIASKSISSNAIHVSIGIREEIERIREQIQNIE